MTAGSPRRIGLVADKMPAGRNAKMAGLLGGRDFNLFKYVFLKGPDLFQPD